jgi:hypothetical protein
MYENVRKEIAKLAEELPKGYGTFDADGKPVIKSELDGLDWYMWATNLLRSKGKKKEKALLISQLVRSEGQDNGGGSLYEMVLALAEPYMTEPDPHRKDRFFKPFGRKVRAFSA